MNLIVSFVPAAVSATGKTGPEYEASNHKEHEMISEVASIADLNRIRRINLSRSNQWHPWGIESWTPADWGVAMMGEAGEVCNVLKKLKRLEDGIGNRKGPDTRVEAIAMLADEIADTFFYLDLLAARMGIDLPTALQHKFNEISEREGLPQRL